MWYIYTMECLLSGKKNVILKFAGKWMELGKKSLSEVAQTQKDKLCMYLLISKY